MVKIKTSKIRKILARSNMSQNEFAKNIGISSGYMAQLLAGVRNPSPVLRARLLKALNMNEKNFDEIFEFKNK